MVFQPIRGLLQGMIMPSNPYKEVKASVYNIAINKALREAIRKT